MFFFFIIKAFTSVCQQSTVCSPSLRWPWRVRLHHLHSCTCSSFLLVHLCLFLLRLSGYRQWYPCIKHSSQASHDSGCESLPQAAAVLAGGLKVGLWCLHTRGLSLYPGPLGFLLTSHGTVVLLVVGKGKKNVSKIGSQSKENSGALLVEIYSWIHTVDETNLCRKWAELKCSKYLIIQYCWITLHLSRLQTPISIQVSTLFKMY